MKRGPSCNFSRKTSTAHNYVRSYKLERIYHDVGSTTSKKVCSGGQAATGTGLYQRARLTAVTGLSGRLCGRGNIITRNEGLGEDFRPAV